MSLENQQQTRKYHKLEIFLCLAYFKDSSILLIDKDDISKSVD